MADDTARPTCRTFDNAGDSICDQPARFIVWGHLYEKRDKGPKCGRHLPRGALLPSGFGTPAIYEITASHTVTAEQVWDAYSGARFTPREPDLLAPDGESAWVERGRVFAMLTALGITVEPTS